MNDFFLFLKQKKSTFNVESELWKTQFSKRIRNANVIHKG